MPANVTRWLVRTAIAGGVVASLIAAACFGWRRIDRSIRDSERNAVYKEGTALDSNVYANGILRWVREADSLRAVAAQVETTIVRHTIRVRDTVWLPRDTTSAPALLTALRACRVDALALASECETYRAVTSLALSARDSAHRADSLRAISLRTVAIAARDTTERERANVRRAERRPQWKTLGEVSIVTALIGYITGRINP